jgi:hypothetical protein
MRRSMIETRPLTIPEDLVGLHSGVIRKLLHSCSDPRITQQGSSPAGASPARRRFDQAAEARI